MIRKIRKFMKGRRGQGMSEDIIMVGLIAVAAIGIYSAFGEQVRNAMGSIGIQLAGDTSSQIEQVETLQSQGAEKTDIKLSDFQNE